MKGDCMCQVPVTTSTICAENEDIFRRLVEFSADWLYWRTPEGEMRYISPAAAIITGYSIEELTAFPGNCAAIIHPDDQAAWTSHVHEADSEGKPYPIDFRILTKHGEMRWISHICRPLYDANGAFLGISGSNRDITERKLNEEQLRFMSTHDTLTGLFNRAFFEAELVRLAAGRQFPVSIVMADIDGLKKVNDRHGHATGDILIKQAAKVLTRIFRAEDMIARIGGDEFSVLLPNADSSVVEELLERVLIAQKKLNSSGSEFPVSLSLGAATVQNGDDLQDALKLADRLMYQDKSDKRI
jgi:diguanylate cyclase (GGDEF)-like protein/PAS domain S-box-containing protein